MFQIKVLEVTGNPSDNGERREPGVEGMRASIRYQYYRTADGHVLFMASERAFWENFCRGVGREDLYENRPGGAVGDHAVGDTNLQRELQAIFETRTTDEWVDFGVAQNCPIGPVNDSQSIMKDRQFIDRFPWLPHEEFGADTMPIPVHLVGRGRRRRSGPRRRASTPPRSCATSWATTMTGSLPWATPWRPERKTPTLTQLRAVTAGERSRARLGH